MRRTAVAVFGLAVLVFLAFAAVPWLTRDRDFPSTIPQPPPLTVQSLSTLGAGDTVCMNEVAIEPHARQARFETGSYNRPGPALELRITGDGYRVVRRIPAGYPDNHRHVVAIDPPPRPLLVTVCFADVGTGKVALYGANDQARSRAGVTKNGKIRDSVAPQLAFYEAKPISIAGRLSSVVTRIAAFHGFLGQAWVVWLLAALTLVGTPLLVGWGLWRAMEDE